MGNLLKSPWKMVCLAGVMSLTAGSGWMLLRAGEDDATAVANHDSCALFTPKARRAAEAKARFERSHLTEEVTAQLGTSLAARQTRALAESTAAAEPVAAGLPGSLIDKHIFDTMRAAGVEPAPNATDLEFLRRATLDLTGRIPTTQKVLAFSTDQSPTRRRDLVEELLANPAWVDKWAMYFGDLYNNTARTAQVVRYDDGRNAFYQWIKTALTQNRAYDKFAFELIATAGDNSYTQGALNFNIGGFVTGGPVQDIYDQQTANVFETFLGISHMNCVLCHSGKGHLDELSLWGKGMTRSQAWQLASHYSRTNMTRARVTPDAAQPYYWAVNDRGAADYRLNTTTGNRPARCAGNTYPAPGSPCAATATVAPAYLDGEKPRAGETYREAFARKVTTDPQFARATVNYVWAEFFGRGLVNPVNQFDPARLDPDNPPAAPWTLQASHPRLLNELAAEFAKNNYDLKWLMREIVNSQAYQLSARYPGTWNAQWEALFARKLVRRLWAEEVHDAIAQSSNLPPSYNVRGVGVVRWAMQLPEPRGLPDGAAGAVSQFLDSFFRGNREDAERRTDFSILQALNLMNDNYVMNRIRGTNRGGPDANEPTLLQSALTRSDDGFIDTVFLAVLSRYPTAEERAACKTQFQSSGGTRQQAGENILWTLYNKADFVYNY